jgi:hypothetical protein
MASLEELRKPVEKMTDDEFHEYINRIRTDRRIRKDKPVTRAKKAENVAKKKTANKLLSKLSPSDLAAILAELERDEKGGSQEDTDSSDQGQ